MKINQLLDILINIKYLCQTKRLKVLYKYLTYLLTKTNKNKIKTLFSTQLSKLLYIIDKIIYFNLICTI